jgi:hypothetical protein
MDHRRPFAAAVLMGLLLAAPASWAGDGAEKKSDADKSADARKADDAQKKDQQGEAKKDEPKLDAQTAALMRRANEAFTAGDYAIALPLLKKVREFYKDQPDKLGPIDERIRVCQKNLGEPADAQSAATDRPDAPAAAAAAAAAAPSNEQRKAHAAPKPGEVRPLTIKDLGNFQYDQEKGGNIPADVKALAGMKVRLNGFMIPMDQADKITKFALVPDLFACCFGQPPQIQHSVTVTCPPGKAVNYYPEEIWVEGTLKVDEKKEDGFILSIFEVDVSSVKPAPK